MTKKNRTEDEELQRDARRKQSSEKLFDELFGNYDARTDIENDITALGDEEEEENNREDEDDDDGTVVVADNPVKSKFFFGFAVVVVVFAIIGLISSVKFVVNGIGSLLDNSSLREEYTGFILPVVANDIAPFTSESEIAASAKVSCSIWNILMNKDISTYKTTADGELIIPEYDVGVSCKELFGSSSEITHQSTGTADTRFIYNESSHSYTCTYNMRYLNYAPSITNMEQNGGVYTLTVDYFPPSITMVYRNIGIEYTAEKTMIYTIWRENGVNTLISVREASSDTE